MVWLWVAGVIAMPVEAQRHVIYNQRIASLQVVAGQRWQEMPVAQLGEPVHIDFDDMTHDYERYSYKIEHCEADWSESREIFTGDFLQGFNGELTIDNYEQSLNTNSSLYALQSYHSQRALPADDERQLQAVGLCR